MMRSNQKKSPAYRSAHLRNSTRPRDQYSIALRPAVAPIISACNGRIYQLVLFGNARCVESRYCARLACRATPCLDDCSLRRRDRVWVQTGFRPTYGSPAHRTSQMLRIGGSSPANPHVRNAIQLKRSTMPVFFARCDQPGVAPIDSCREQRFAPAISRDHPKRGSFPVTSLASRRIRVGRAASC